MADPHGYSVSVAAAVLGEDGRLLAIKRRDNGHWEPPGGVLEAGEPAAEGMAREVREETGLNVEPVRLSGVYQNLSRDILSLVFLARRSSGQLRTSDESVQVEWLTEEDVRHRMTEAYAVRLLDAVRTDEGVPVRTHDGRRLI
jgi:ADP-ribose pyrophosphatase YjhB (NUDIX family)